jgi:predicted AAA+ superfamily ATPase
MYKRPQFKVLSVRLQEPRRFIQVLSGPRQSGKTTLIGQVLKELPAPSRYASADAPEAHSSAWVEQQWNEARLALASSPSRGLALALDEIQKVPAWSDTIKKLWDEDTLRGLDLKVVLLGSSSLLLQRGLTESLAGRFEILRLGHWTYAEMKEAFGFDLSTYVYFGGYPGAAPLVSDEQRWRDYVRDSIVETTISRDILMMSRVDKPALLRQLFELGALYSGRVLSFNKMLGQLQDAGNTTTLSHYLDLLGAAGLMTGLLKYSAAPVRRRASSPRLQVLNTGLMSALAGSRFAEVRQDPAAWGRLVESSVGAHLLASGSGHHINLSYWREGRREVDFVLERGGRQAAIEVKSGWAREGIPGVGLFLKRYPGAKAYLVGGDGMQLEEFFRTPVSDLIS